MTETLSVVVPSYGCGECVTELINRLLAVLDDCSQDAFEVIIVDDRSPDGSWETTAKLAAAERRVKAIRLSRNFGQHAAISAGLAASVGDVVVVMDCDLQDPPELIPTLLEALDGDVDIVFSRRSGHWDPRWRRFLARISVRVLSAASGARVPMDVGSFSAIRRKVVESYLRLGALDVPYLLVLRWLGFSTVTIDYERQARPYGRSSYTLRRLLSLGISGLLFQSTRLLLGAVYLGFVVVALGFVMGAIIVVNRITGTSLAGWTSILAVLLGLGGVIITLLGAIGLYLGRVFEQTRRRPKFVVDETIS